MNRFDEPRILPPKNPKEVAVRDRRSTRPESTSRKAQAAKSRPGPRLTEAAIDDIVRRYESGHSVKRIAKDIGVVRATVTRSLHKRNVTIRTISEQGRIEWKRWKAEGRTEEIVGPANKAARGRKASDEELTRRAVTMSTFAKLGHGEKELATLLRKSGLKLKPQLPCGAYNVDIALTEPRLAVEVLGRPLNRKARMVFRERTEHLVNEGWGLVFVKLYQWRTSHDLGAIAKNLIALSERACRDEPARGQYWVIDSDGETITTGRADPDRIAVEITSHRGRDWAKDSRTG